MSKVPFDVALGIPLSAGIIWIRTADGFHGQVGNVTLRVHKDFEDPRTCGLGPRNDYGYSDVVRFEVDGNSVACISLEDLAEHTDMSGAWYEAHDRLYEKLSLWSEEYLTDLNVAIEAVLMHLSREGVLLE